MFSLFKEKITAQHAGECLASNLIIALNDSFIKPTFLEQLDATGIELHKVREQEIFTFVVTTIISIEGSLRGPCSIIARQAFSSSVSAMLSSDSRWEWLGNSMAYKLDDFWARSSCLPRHRPGFDLFKWVGEDFAFQCVRHEYGFESVEFQLLSNIGRSLFSVFTDRSAKFLESFRIVE